MSGTSPSISSILERIQQAAPDPIELPLDELAAIRAWYKQPVSNAKLQKAAQGDREAVKYRDERNRVKLTIAYNDERAKSSRIVHSQESYELPPFMAAAKKEAEERRMREARMAAETEQREVLERARKPLNEFLSDLFSSRKWPWDKLNYERETIDEIANRMMKIHSELSREPLASNLDKLDRIALRFGDKYSENAVDCGIQMLKHIRDDQRASLDAILQAIPGAQLWAAFDVIRVPMLWDHLFSGPPVREHETPAANDGEDPKKQKKKPGRPSDTDHKLDRQIAEAWATKRYLRYAELDLVFHLSKGGARRAVERHKKRMRRAADNRCQSE